MEQSEYISATARQQSSKSKHGTTTINNVYAPVSLIDSRVFNHTVSSNISESQLEHDFERDQTSHSQLNSQSEEDGFFNGGTTPPTYRQTSEFASSNLPLQTIAINQIFTKVATSDYKGDTRRLTDLELITTSNNDTFSGSKNNAYEEEKNHKSGMGGRSGGG